MNAKTTKDLIDNAQHRDAAADVATDVPCDARDDIAVDDRERRADILWIRAEDLIAIYPRVPAGPAALGQHEHDSQLRRQGAGVPGVVSVPRSRRVEVAADTEGVLS